MVRAERNPKLLGVGLDNEDGMIRVTRGENFHLVGGSEQTHESMQEKCLRFNEKLQADNKQLKDLDQEEFLELAAECEMNVLVPKRRRE